MEGYLRNYKLTIIISDHHISSSSCDGKRVENSQSNCEDLTTLGLKNSVIDDSHVITLYSSSGCHVQRKTVKILTICRMCIIN